MRRWVVTCDVCGKQLAAIYKLAGDPRDFCYDCLEQDRHLREGYA